MQYARRVALLPATKTNASAQKIGTPPEKSFFGPARSLPLDLDH
jgi:hypothetical protein